MSCYTHRYLSYSHRAQIGRDGVMHSRGIAKSSAKTKLQQNSDRLHCFPAGLGWQLAWCAEMAWQLLFQMETSWGITLCLASLAAAFAAMGRTLFNMYR